VSRTLPPWLHARRPWVGIDLGSHAIRMVTAEGGRVAHGPSWLERQRGDSTTRIYPMLDGHLADPEAAGGLIARQLQRLPAGHGRGRLRLAISFHGLPTTPPDAPALRHLLGAHPADHALIPSAPLAAWGAGLPVFSPTATLVVDGGFGQVDASLIHAGRIIHHDHIPLGIDTLAARLARWIQRSANLMVSDEHAENAFRAVASAKPTRRVRTVRIHGRDLSTGAPRPFDLHSGHAHEALKAEFQMIVEMVAGVIRGAPPECCADLAGHGGLLVGGLAHLPGLDDALRDATGLPFIVPDQPDHMVYRGLAALLAAPKTIPKLALFASE